MGQTTTIHTIYGVSKAKTDKAVLVEIEDNGSVKQSWMPLSIVGVRFIGKNFQIKVTVPGWFFRKIDWKAPQVYTPKAKPAAPKNPYIGSDVGNMMEELMILNERLSHEEYEYGMYQDSDDDRTLVTMAIGIEELKIRIRNIQEAVAIAQQ